MPRRSPTFARMMARAAVLRCPWCGSRRTFVAGWFRRHDRCRSCGIRWNREVGFELGAVTFSTIVTFAAIVLSMVVGFVLTVPDVAVVPMLVVTGAIAVVVPVAFYPFSYTTWLAFDLAVHAPDAAELAEARAAVTGSADAVGSEQGAGVSSGETAIGDASGDR